MRAPCRTTHRLVFAGAVCTHPYSGRWIVRMYYLRRLCLDFEYNIKVRLVRLPYRIGTEVTRSIFHECFLTKLKVGLELSAQVSDVRNDYRLFFVTL